MEISDLVQALSLLDQMTWAAWSRKHMVVHTSILEWSGYSRNQRHTSSYNMRLNQGLTTMAIRSKWLRGSISATSRPLQMPMALCL